MTMEKTLEISNLEVSARDGKKSFAILRGINLCAEPNQAVALVGESGSGKTMTAMSVMRLLPRNLAVDRGRILLRGEDILAMSESQMRHIRGKVASMIFQEPSSYLNPLFTVGSQVMEAVKNGEERFEKTMKMFEDVELERNVYFQYPHQLSGGMQQRVMIAMAMINNPALLIADEPTTALDVTTANGIVLLLRKMMDKYGLSVLFITHDMSLAASFAEKIGVMYAGRLVEFSDAAGIFKSPLHPYTEKLIDCLPERYAPGSRIRTVEGSVPDFRQLPGGCPFHLRCPYKITLCTQRKPGPTLIGTTTVRCFKYGDDGQDS